MTRQPPAYSPLGLGDLRDMVRRGLFAEDDPRDALKDVLKRRYAADEVALCGSGTMALQLALSLAMRERGADTVALPAYSCYDVATAAVGADANVLLYDVDPGSLGPDLDSLRRALDRGAGVAVVAPLFGMPVDWDALEEVLAPHGALAVEDAAQGHGALWRGVPLGALGAVSVLSFARGKGWTGVHGGALLTRGEAVDVSDLKEPGTLPRPTARAALETAAAALGQWALGRPRLYGLPAAVPWLHLGETRYREPRTPRGMSRAAAALLCRNREAADREAGTRRRNAAAILESLPSQPGLEPVRAPAAARPGYLRFPLRLPGGMAGFGDPEPALRLGAAPGYPATLAQLPALRQRLAAGGEHPGAEALARDLVTLPTHSRIGGAERAELLHLLNGRPRR